MRGVRGTGSGVRGPVGPGRPLPLSLSLILFLSLSLFPCPPLLSRPQAPDPRPESLPEPAGRAPSEPAPVQPRPRLAIVIDDTGDAVRDLAPFLSVPLALSFAILPDAPEAGLSARALQSQGRDVMIHLPMEPLEAGARDRPGFLTTDMDEPAVRAALAVALEQVPGARGVNNHMGSRFTRDAASMARVARALKDRGLFFLDSRTDPGTVAFATCRDEGLPALQRDVFLDNEPDEALILARLLEAQSIARSRGQAVAIGHLRPQTAAALMRFAADRDVDVVPVSALLDPGFPPEGATPRFSLPTTPRVR